jgi:hypothetical protein
VTATITGGKTFGSRRADNLTNLIVTIVVAVTTEFAAGVFPELRLRAEWSTQARFPDRPASDDRWDREAEAIGRQVLDPAGLGVTPVNDHSFIWTRTIPDPYFGGSIFSFASQTPIGSGSYLLGGTVSPFPSLDTSIARVQVKPFLGSYGIDAGCKDGTREILPAQASTFLRNHGKICSTQLLSPDPSRVPLEDLGVYSPATGGVTMPPSIGETVHNQGTPVRVLFRTPRGVRIVNYGLPPDPRFDAEGNATNLHLEFGHDCFGDWKAINRWYLLLGEWALKRDLPRPPTWGTVYNPHDIAMFETGITRVRVDQVGDALILERPLDGAGNMSRSYFTANANNDVLVPIFTIIGPNTSSGARLSKLSRADVGVVSSHSKTFSRLATLTHKDAVLHSLSSDEVGAIVTTTLADGHIEVTRVTGDGKVEKFKQDQQHELSAGNTIQAPPAAEEMWKPNIAGVKSVHYIPGFEDKPVTVAELADGGYRLLTRASDTGAISVTGLMPDWPKLPPIAVAGQWAISGTSETYVSVYRVKDNRKGKTKPFDEGQEAAAAKACGKGSVELVVDLAWEKQGCVEGCKGK